MTDKQEQAKKNAIKRPQTYRFYRKIYKFAAFLLTAEKGI